MTPLIQNFRYRPEIDGLRAVAVLAVVLYHAGLGFPGGYIGVDVFFVVSGYLITSLIIKDLQEGKFTFSGFWERRARRIIPAMAVLVIATLVAGWFLLLPHDYAQLGRSAVFQGIFGANIHFWMETGYFAGLADEQPLLHTWSLAVEEQFYLFVPLILFGLFRLRAMRKTGPLLLLIGIAIFMSLGASVYGVARHPSAAFYFLPTRAWELLCGSFVALLPATLLPKFRPVRECLAWLGMLGILIPCWFYTKNTPFPGMSAVPPCFGTAVFIWATGRRDAQDATPLTLAGLLSARPVVFIGLISYSLYLWHWPLFAFSSYWVLQPMSVGYRLAMVALGLALAVLSWRFVETPFRKRTFCAAKPAMLAFGGGSIAVVLMLGGILMLQQGFPARLPREAILLSQATDDRGFIHELKAADVQRDKLVPIGNPDSAAPVSVLVWGDSHAMAAMPAFDEFLKEQRLAGRQATASATAPLLGSYWRNEFTNPKDAKAFNEAVFAYIAARKIPEVVLVGYWENYTDDKSDVPLDLALLATIERLVKAGARPWVFLQVPHHSFAVPRALALETIFHRDLTPVLAKPTEWNGLRGSGSSLIEKVQAAGGQIMDPRPGFLDATGNFFIVEKDGVPLYRDAHHLSGQGAKMMIVPLLRQAFKLTNSGLQVSAQ